MDCGVIPMCRDVPTCVPTCSKIEAGRTAVQHLLAGPDGASGVRSPPGGLSEPVLGGNVPTCVPTCSNIGFRRQYGTSESNPGIFFMEIQNPAIFRLKKVQSRGVPTVPTFASSGNSDKNLFFSLLSGGSRSWNLEHFSPDGPTVWPDVQYAAHFEARNAQPTPVRLMHLPAIAGCQT